MSHPGGARLGRVMTRSWLAFGVGVVVLLSPLRLVWARTGAPAWSIFVVWGLLVAVGWATTRGRT